VGRDVASSRRCSGRQFPRRSRQLQTIVPEYSEPHHDRSSPCPCCPNARGRAARRARPRPSLRTWRWRRTPRQVIESGLAAVLLALSSPLWVVLWVETRLIHRQPLLVFETRIGRSRRRTPRRTRRTGISSTAAASSGARSICSGPAALCALRDRMRAQSGAGSVRPGPGSVPRCSTCYD